VLRVHRHERLPVTDIAQYYPDWLVELPSDVQASGAVDELHFKSRLSPQGTAQYRNELPITIETLNFSLFRVLPYVILDPIVQFPHSAHERTDIDNRVRHSHKLRPRGIP